MEELSATRFTRRNLHAEEHPGSFSGIKRAPPQHDESDSKRSKTLAEIISSPREQKSFKRINLSNGMRAVLISTKKKELNLTLNEKTYALVEVENFNKDIIHVEGIVPNPQESEIISASPNVISPEERNGISFIAGDRSTGEGIPASPGAGAQAVFMSSKCGVILTVGVGNFHDPEDYPGMAHLVEHAFFLGSKKYPEESSFLTHMQKIEGSANAFTEGERTTYYFETLEKDFDLTLEMMGDMMTNPLMREDSVIREAEAVDCEWAIRKSKDFLRVVHLVGMFAADQHPIKKFSCGNKSTLTPNNELASRLREWKDKYYEARHMSLVIYGPQDFPELEAKAEKNFGGIKAGCSPNPLDSLVKAHGPPFQNSPSFSTLYRVTPVLDVKILTITWAFPPSVWQNFATKPMTFVSYLINHKGQGGLYDLLKRQGLIFSMYGGSMNNNTFQNRFMSVFGIGLELTDLGTKRVTVIVEQIFSYLKFLTSDPSQKIFTDLAHYFANSFHYTIPKATSLAVGLVLGKNLHIPSIPEENLLVSTQLLTDFNRCAIDEFLALLRPDTANYLLLDKEFSKKCEKREKYHEAPYTECKIPRKVLEDWKSPKTKCHFTLFPSNDYIPHGNLFLKNGPKIAGVRRYAEKSKVSMLYVNSPCSAGEVSRAAYSFTFVSPVLAGMGARQSALIYLMAKIMNVEMQSREPNAFAAGIACQWMVGHGNIIAYASGESYKMEYLLTTIFEVLKNADCVDPNHYENMRSHTRSAMNNLLMDNETYSKDITNKLTLNTYNTCSEMEAELKCMPLEDYIAFVKSFKERMFVQGTLLGAIPEFHFDLIIGALKGLNFKPITVAEIPVNKSVVIPLGEKCVRVNSKNPEDNTSVISNFYYLGILSEKDGITTSTIAKMIPRELFVQLRTKEQIGYHVSATISESFKAYGISVTVKSQSDKFTTAYVNERIDNFMEQFYKERLCTGDFPELAEYFQKHLLQTGSEFRKLTVQVIAPQACYDNNPKCCKAEPEKVNIPRGNCKGVLKLTCADEPMDIDIVMAPRKICEDLQVRGVEYSYSREDLGGKSVNEYFISDIEAFKQGLFVCPNNESNVKVKILSNIDEL